MKLKFILGVSSALCLCATIAQAQETNWEKRLQQMSENFARQQREMQERFDKKTAAQDAEIESLKKQLGGLPPAPLLGASSSAASASAGQGSFAPAQTALAPKPWTPSDPIRVGKGGTYMNISFDALVAAGASTANDIESLQLGGHDPKQRGFTIQNLETGFDGAVDPYFRGQANIVMQLNAAGETTVEAEEAYLETMSLPLNLQVKAGQFFTEFGRLNPQHPHSWAFVDQPLVNGRFLGEDGLRNPGVRLSWLAPTPFYSELFFTVQNSQGGTAHSFRDRHGGDPFFGRVNTERSVKKFSDMLYSARYAASFEPTENQTLLGGLSAVFGPNSSGTNSDTATQIYGADVYWKWKSPRAHGGFPFVTWQTEAMLRRYQAGASTTVDLNNDTVLDPVPRETVTDWGAYSQLAWGFKPGWIAALRGDFVTGDKADYEKLYGADVSRATRWRVSPNLTWFPSEFSKIRLQYNYDHRDLIGVDHSIWLQFEFLLGAHAAHKF